MEYFPCPRDKFNSINKYALSKCKNDIIILRGRDILFYSEAINIFMNFIGRRDKSTGCYSLENGMMGMLAKLKNEKVTRRAAPVVDLIPLRFLHIFLDMLHGDSINLNFLFQTFFFALKNHFLT